MCWPVVSLSKTKLHTVLVKYPECFGSISTPVENQLTGMLRIKTDKQIIDIKGDEPFIFFFIFQWF